MTTMHRIQTMFRMAEAPLHYVEDDNLQIGDVIEAEHGGLPTPMTVKIVEVRETTEEHQLGETSLGRRPIRICIVARPRA